MDISVTMAERAGTVAMIGQFWEHDDFAKFETCISVMLEKKPQYLILDLSRLSFTSSQGLGKLVRVYSEAEQVGTELVLLGPSGSVRETIEMSGFAVFMKVLDTPDDLQKYVSAKG